MRSIAWLVEPEAASVATVKAKLRRGVDAESLLGSPEFAAAPPCSPSGFAHVSETLTPAHIRIRRNKRLAYISPDTAQKSRHSRKRLSCRPGLPA